MLILNPDQFLWNSQISWTILFFGDIQVGSVARVARRKWEGMRKGLNIIKFPE